MTMQWRSISCATTLIAIALAVSLHATDRRGEQAVPPPPPPPAVMQTPARDIPTVAATGTASVTGTVTADDENHMPLRHVTLTLSRSGLNDSRVTGTDDRGRFLFDRLPPGNYLLSASKGAYVPAQYGATKLGLPGSPIPLVEGQQFTAHPMTLVHGAVITGMLTDAKGKPVADTQVEATQFQTINGERRRRNFGGVGSAVSTDAHGVYRLYGLAPGDYLVSANTRLFVVANADIRELTPAEFQWARQQVQGAAAPVAPAPPPPKPITPAPTFYPGTGDVAVAAVVTLNRAEERQGVDFQLQYISTSRVSGVVIGADGQPAPGAVVVRASNQSGNQFAQTFDVAGTARAGGEGRFSYASVAPGAYSLNARSAPAAGSGRGGGPGQPPMPTMWGRADVTVNGDDISGVTIQLQPGMSVSGKVVFEGTTPPPADLTRVQPRLQAETGTTSVSVAVNNAPVGANADGTFKIDDVTPGLYRMTAGLNGAANGWAVKSASLNGRNVLDVPFEIHPSEDISDLVITFSDQHTELSGKLMEADGKPAPQFFVLAFPTDKKYWTPQSRWVKPARAGVDGGFKITGLPPGEYYFCALTEVDQTQLFDPGYLEQFISESMKLTLGDGEKKTQDLRVGG